MRQVEYEIFEILFLVNKYLGLRKINTSKITFYLKYRLPYEQIKIETAIIKRDVASIIPIHINRKKNRKVFVISKKQLDKYYKKNITFLRPISEIKREYYGI